MPQPNNTIDQLVSLLDGGADRPLTEPERTLLRAALAELAGAQALIARQSALLASYEHDARAIGVATSEALSHMRRLMSPPGPAASYDFGAAEAARTELLRRLDDAAQGRDILDAVLRFVAPAVRLSL